MFWGVKITRSYFQNVFQRLILKIVLFYFFAFSFPNFWGINILRDWKSKFRAYNGPEGGREYKKWGWHHFGFQKN